MTQRLINPLSKFTTDTLQSLPGATFSFFVSGSSTIKAVYADKAKVTSLGAIVTADSAGIFPPIWLDGAYRVTLRSASTTPSANPADGVVQTGWPIDSVGDDALTASSLDVSGDITAETLTLSEDLIVVDDITCDGITAAGTISGNAIASTTTVTGTTITASGALSGASLASSAAASVGTTLTLGSTTTVVTAGTIWYDGKTFYANPFASNKAIVDSSHICVLSSDYTGSDVNTAQKVFNSTTTGTINLPASTSYDFEALYVITRVAGTTSHTTSVLFGGTAALTSIMYLAEATSSNGNVLTAPSYIYATAATATVVTAASTTAAENIIVRLRGQIRTNSAGTLIPQFQFSAAPGGTPTILKNSFIKLSPIGIDTVTTAGNWT